MFAHMLMIIVFCIDICYLLTYLINFITNCKSKGILYYELQKKMISFHLLNIFHFGSLKYLTDKKGLG